MEIKHSIPVEMKLPFHSYKNVKVPFPDFRHFLVMACSIVYQISKPKKSLDFYRKKNHTWLGSVSS